MNVGRWRQWQWICQSAAWCALFLGATAWAQELPGRRPELFSEDEKLLYFVSLVFFATVGGTGKILMFSSIDEPRRHQVGKLLFGVFLSVMAAWWLWGEGSPTKNMVKACLLAPAADVALGWILRLAWGPAFPTNLPPERGGPA